MNVLGPTWGVQFFTSLEALPATAIPHSAPFLRAIADQRIEIKYLPDDVNFGSHADVSLFLTRPWIWEQLAPARHVLLFQGDSIICMNSPHTVDEFLMYDLVGAPIAEGFGQGYNGGLSLRNRTMVLEILEEHDFAHDTNQPGRGLDAEFEDQWYYARMKERGAVLPTYEVAKTFAVETIFYEYPLGYHQPDRWQADNMDEIRKWCPEVGLITKGHFY
jgi:hypothetical protein